MYLILLFIIILIAIFLTASSVKEGAAEAPRPQFVIYYSVECPFCMRAIKLLQEKRARFVAVKIDDFAALIKKLGKKLPKTHRTKPIIFKSGKFLGGYAELAAHFDVKTV